MRRYEYGHPRREKRQISSKLGRAARIMIGSGESHFGWIRTSCKYWDFSYLICLGYSVNHSNDGGTGDMKSRIEQDVTWIHLLSFLHSFEIRSISGLCKSCFTSSCFSISRERHVDTNSFHRAAYTHAHKSRRVHQCCLPKSFKRRKNSDCSGKSETCVSFFLFFSPFVQWRHHAAPMGTCRGKRRK